MSADLKPYPAMKDSGVPWLGEVPEHWKQLPGRACYRERQVPNTGLIETTVLSLSYGRIVVKPVDKLHGLVPASFDTYQIVEPGNIIIRPTDLQNDWNSLRFGLSHNRGIITSAYLCFHTTDLWTREYGHLLLHTYDLSKVFYGLGSGLRQNLDWTDFKYLPCLVPPLPEQASIVRFLDHADWRIRCYIRAKQQLIALLEEQKQAIIHQAVTGQIDVRTGKPYQAYKPSGVEWFPEVPDHWNVLPMRRVIYSAVDGPHFSPTYLDTGIPFLSARNVKSHAWSLEDAKYISEDDYDEFNRRVKPVRGDVLYTKGGTTGVARVVDLTFPFQVWVHIAVLKVNKNAIDPEFLAAALNSTKCYEQSQLFTRGATNQDLGLGRMKGIELPVPPALAEQQAIVGCLRTGPGQVVEAISATHREIGLLREYRTRLIADVVTGKLDVRAAAERLPDEVEELEPLDEADALIDGEEEPTDVLATAP